MKRLLAHLPLAAGPWPRNHRCMRCTAANPHSELPPPWPPRGLPSCPSAPLTAPRACNVPNHDQDKWAPDGMIVLRDWFSESIDHKTYLGLAGVWRREDSLGVTSIKHDGAICKGWRGSGVKGMARFEFVGLSDETP